MVAPNLAGNASLAQHLHDLIGRSSATPWIENLSLLVPPNHSLGGAGDLHHDDGEEGAKSSSDLNDLDEVVGLRFNRSLLASNTDMAAQRLASAMWPGLRAHSRTYEGRTASVYIRTGNDCSPENIPETLSEVLGFDLTLFWSEVDKGVDRIGICADRVTLYTIRLADTSYRIITLTCHSEPEDWTRFKEWRSEIKTKFGIDTRLTYEAPVLLQRSDASSVSAADVGEKIEKYQRKRSRESIPAHLKGVVADWRDEEFCSLDGGVALRPEDLFKTTQQPDGGIGVKIALPMVGGPRQYFVPFEDTISIGLSATIGVNGTLNNCSAQPAVTHNTFPLDTASVSQIATLSDLEEGGGSERVRLIRSNQFLVNNIRDVYEVARRILARQVMAGSPVSLQLTAHESLSRERVSADCGERLQPEFVVSTVLAFAQQQLAKWCLTINPLFPLIALRAHFDDSPAVAEIQRIIPWFSERSLYYPEERNSVAKELRALGREDMVLRLVNLLRGGVRRHRLRIVESVDEIFPEDIFRFKTYRSTIGSVNNLQMSAALVGSAPLDGGLVHEIAAAINKRRTEPSPSGALLPQVLGAQIEEANRRAAKHLGFRSQ